MKKASMQIEVTLNPGKKMLTNTKTTQNPKKFRIKLLREDLTIQETNAIVNAANGELHLGAGVAGAIRMKGGNKIQYECDDVISKDNKNKSLKNGDVAYTNIGKFQNENLHYIFHAVGPMYFNGKRNEKGELTNCFLNCFKLADKLKLKSIAIPPISTGIFGYPKKEGARVFYDCVERYFKEFFNANEIHKEEEMKEIFTISGQNESLFIETNSEKNVQGKVNQKKNPTQDSLFIDHDMMCGEDKGINNDINQNNSLQSNPDITDNKNSQIINDKEYEDINKETIKIKDKTQKFVNINEAPKNDDINLSFSFGTDSFKKMDITDDNTMKLTPDLGEFYSKKNETESSNNKETKHANELRNPLNNQFNNINEKFYSGKKEILNVQTTMKDNYMNNEKCKLSRIIDCKYNENSEIRLENYTLNDIKMVIIDEMTFEIFYEIFKEKILDWRNNDEYKFNVE